MTSVRLPRLLNNDLSEARRLQPVDGSLDLTMVPLSTASLTVLTKDAAPVGSWVEMYSPNGSAGIYRVSTVDNGHGTELTSLELEHGIAEVGNYIVNGEISEEMPLNVAISQLWGFYKGNRWRIGSNAFTDRVLVDVLYDNLLQAILDLLEQTSGYMMAFDFSTNPWTINIVRKDTTVSAEGRLSRNVSEAHVVYDLTELCTRVYVDFDADDSAGGAVSVDADTISQYGIIEKHVSGSGYTYGQAQAVAREYLEKHKRPKIGATITGVDFASVTGELLDRLAIGKLYRLAVPKYNVVVEQHISGLSWSHLYSDPSAVEISLGVEEDRVVSYMQHTTETVAKSGKGTIKKQGRYWTKFDRTDHYIDQVAAYTDENGNVLKQAGMYIDANGVLQYAQDNEKQVGSQFKVAADRITAEVTQRENGERALYSNIEQTATSIRTEVVNVKSGLESSITQTASQIRSEVKSTKEGLETQIKQNKDSIELTVKKGDVATQLAVEAGNVSIRNGNLVVDGMVTAASVKAAVANISDLTVGGVIRAQHYYLGTGALPTAMIDSGTYDVRITPSGNNYILQKQTYSNLEWQDVSTFSRATSLSGAWSSSAGRFIVTASPQGETYPVKVAYSSGFTPPGQSESFNVIRPSASGYDWLRVWQQVGSLDTSTGIRTVKTFAGSSPVESTDITDYKTGYDAVGAPSVSFTAVDARATGNPSGTASIANKTGGGTRRTSIGMTMSRSVFSPTGGATERCVNVSYNNTTVGRISVQADYDAGESAGYAAGDSDGYTRGYKVTDGDISISVDSDAHTSRGDRVEIWSSRPGFANQSWYYFDVTVHGHTKQYAIYMKRA